MDLRIETRYYCSGKVFKFFSSAEKFARKLYNKRKKFVVIEEFTRKIRNGITVCFWLSDTAMIGGDIERKYNKKKEHNEKQRKPKVLLRSRSGGNRDYRPGRASRGNKSGKVRLSKAPAKGTYSARKKVTYVGPTGKGE